MAALDVSKAPVADLQQVRDEWLSRLDALVDSVKTWAEEIGWATRVIDKRMDDSELGDYRAPALLMQEGTVRVLLEPISRFAPGTEGVVDLYWMPAYDDIARLYFEHDRWLMHYEFPGSSAPPVIDASTSTLLSRESVQDVLEQMKRHAA